MGGEYEFLFPCQKKFSAVSHNLKSFFWSEGKSAGLRFLQGKQGNLEAGLLRLVATAFPPASVQQGSQRDGRCMCTVAC